MQKTKLWYINTNSLFMALPENEKMAMAKMMHTDEVKKKGRVYTAGDKSDKIYVLKEGKIKLSRQSIDGRELTVDLLEPGDIFGELSIAGEEERGASAEALEDSLICATDRIEFEDFISKNPAFSLAITKLMGFRLRRIETRLENLIFHDVHTRLQLLFNDLAEKYGQHSSKGNVIKLKLTHQDIANLIGSSRETVTLEVNNLKKEGFILMEGRNYILPNKVFS